MATDQQVDEWRARSTAYDLLRRQYDALTADNGRLLGENERLHEQLQIAKDGLVEIRNLDRSDWKPEAVKAHETLTRLGWRP